MTVTKLKTKPAKPGKLSPKKETELGRIIVELNTARDEQKAANAKVQAAQDKLLALMNGGEAKVSVTSGGRVYTATRTHSTSKYLNEDQLRKSLGARLWTKVTDKVLSRDKLEKLVSSGEVDPTLVSQCITEKHSAEFVKVTSRKSGDSE